MPPKTRSNTASTSKDKGKQADSATMAAIGDAELVELTAGLKDSNDPNRLLLLNIIANQKTVDEKLEKRFGNLDDLIKSSKATLEKHIKDNDEVIDSVKRDVTGNTTEINTLRTTVKTLSDDIATIQAKYDATQKLLDETTESITKFAATIGKLDSKYQREEDETMRCQLLIDGVKEQGTKRPKAVVINLLKDLSVKFSEADIKSAYRLGPVNDSATRPRSIKVQFTSNQFKYEIFKNVQKLKDKENWKGVHLSDAISPEEQDKRRDMRCIYAVGKAKGVDIELKGSNIVIDGIKYRHNDIHNLPKGLSIEQVKIVTTKDGTAFQSHHAFLSSMYPTKIMYEGIDYKSAEHLYYAEMARHHNRLDLVNDIIKAKDGYAAKRIGKKITDRADDWETVKIKIMTKIVHLKFDQNDSLRDKLLATKGPLYEATKGDSFSCGMSLAQAADIAKDSIPNANHLGIILCEYRDEYLGL